MNALADEMTPYLHASGITVTRNDPDGQRRAVHPRFQRVPAGFPSGAALGTPRRRRCQGRLRGVDIYYYPTSEAGLRMAEHSG